VEEVNVVGTKIERSTIDRKSLDLEDSLAHANGSLLDALRSLPGITFDQDGRVLLRGSDKVSILVDGKQSGLTGFGGQRGLDSIPSANIARIEVINNPSARYDAVGSAGIINVIYKDNKQKGWSGDFGFMLGVGQLGKEKDDLPTELGSYSNNNKYMPSINLGFTTDDVQAFFQAEYLVQDSLPNNEHTERRYDNGDVIVSQVPENREQDHYIIKMGMDWKPSQDRIFSVGLIYDFETHTDRAQVPFINTTTDQQERYWFWTEEEDTGFFNVSVNHKWLFSEPGHELDVRAEYTRGWEDEAYFLNEISDVRIGDDMTHLKAEENTLPLSVDYVRPLKDGRIELGAKLQRRWIPITYDVERGEGSVIYEGLGDESHWEEDIAAMYLNYVRETTDFDIEVGLRVEQTDVEYEIPEENIYYPSNDSYDYLELFPNVKLTWQATDSQRTFIAYNRRVDRPGEPELRIFPKYDDPELLKVGNPYLRPQFADVIELGYEFLWDSGSVSTAVYHRDIDDAFIRVFAIDDTNPNYDIVNKIFQNIDHTQHQGIELLFSQDIAERWEFSASLNWYEITIDAFETNVLFPTSRPFSIQDSKDDTYDLQLNNELNLPFNVSMQLSYNYQAKRNIPQGTQRARSTMDIGLKRKFLNDKAEVVFSASDILNDYAVRQDIEGNGFSASYENYNETQVARLTMKYRF